MLLLNFFKRVLLLAVAIHFQDSISRRAGGPGVAPSQVGPVAGAPRQIDSAPSSQSHSCRTITVSSLGWQEPSGNKAVGTARDPEFQVRHNVGLQFA